MMSKSVSTVRRPARGDLLINARTIPSCATGDCATGNCSITKSSNHQITKFLSSLSRLLRLKAHALPERGAVIYSPVMDHRFHAADVAYVVQRVAVQNNQVRFLSNLDRP